MFDHIPPFLFYAIPLFGVAAIVCSIFLKIIPFVNLYYIPIRILGFVSLGFGIFLLGGLYSHNSWKEKVFQLEVEVKDLKVLTAKENIKIVEKLIYKVNTIKEKGEDITKTIEITVAPKDSQCKVPQEFIDVLNKAAMIDVK